MSFDLSILTSEWKSLLEGLLLTLLIWTASSLLGVVLGFAVALAQLFLGRTIGAVLQGYVWLIRGTPFLIQLFIVYYGGPFFGLDLSPFTAGILGLMLYGGAYFAEIFRSGFLSVARGQIEAAKVVGLTPGQIVRHIQLPQMMVIITPALANMVIILGKETAVLSVITVNELTAVVSGIGSTTFAYAETLLFLTLVYWLLVELCSMFARWIEQKFGHFTIRSPS